MARTTILLGAAAAFALGVLAGWALRGPAPARASGGAPAAGTRTPTLDTAFEDTPASELVPPAAPAPSRTDARPAPGAEDTPSRPTDPPQEAFTVHGRVQDAAGRPLRQAEVTLITGDRSQGGRPEGADGAFRFEQVPAGTLSLLVEEHDHYPFETTIALDGPARRHFVPVVLEPRARVPVRVVTLSGEEFRRFRLLGATDGTPEDIALALRTRELTAHVLERPLEPLSLAAGGRPRALGFEPIVYATGDVGVIGVLTLERPPPVVVGLFQGALHLESRTLRPGDEEVVFTVDPARLAAGFGSLRLRVVDDGTGEPVSCSARLRLGSGGGSMASTQPDGTFVFRPILPAALELEVLSPEHLPLSRSLRLEAGQTLDLGTLRLTPAPTLRGRVVDDLGRPVADLRISYALEAEGLDGQRVLEATTDGEGRFLLGGLPPGPLLVHGIRRSPLRTSPPLRLAPRVLDPREAGSGELELQAGAAGAVELYPEAGPLRRVRIVDPSGVTVDRGRVGQGSPLTVWLLPGDYVAVLTASDGAEERVPFSAGGAWTQVRLP